MLLLFGMSFVTTVLMILALRPVAVKFGLVDIPDARKQHLGSVPLVGGLAVFLSIALIAIVFQSAFTFPFLLLALGFILVALGVVDDLLNLSAGFRMVCQLLVSTLMVLVGDVRIEFIGAIMGGSDLVFSYSVSVVFTVLCAVGVINAVNMIDGLDGLSGSILFISFGALAFLTTVSGSSEGAMLYALCAALAGFLYFNSRVLRERAAVFLGDSGSMFLGLVLVWFFVELTQNPSSVALGAVSAGWVFGLPLLDTVNVMMGRVLDKRSPFLAGRDHLHHLLLNRGFTANQTVGLMITVHCVLVGVGVMFANTPGVDPYLFWGFVVMTVIYFIVTRFVLDEARYTRLKRRRTVVS